MLYFYYIYIEFGSEKKVIVVVTEMKKLHAFLVNFIVIYRNEKVTFILRVLCNIHWLIKCCVSGEYPLGNRMSCVKCHV